MPTIMYKNINYSGGGGGGSDVKNLSDLTDINLNNLTNKQILEYNSTTEKWENKNINTATITPVIISGEKIADFDDGTEFTKSLYTSKITPLISNGTEIAKIEKNNEETFLKIPAIEYEPVLTEGVLIGRLKIGNQLFPIYAPEGGGGGGDEDMPMITEYINLSRVEYEAAIDVETTSDDYELISDPNA